MHYRELAGLSFAAALVAGAAQAQDAETCKILANNLSQDVLIQGSSSAQFYEMRKLVSQERFRDFATAQNSTLGLDINVMNYVDAALNTTSDSGTWEVNRDRFLNMSYETMAASAKSNLERRQFNVAALKAISDCATIIANSQGFFANLVEVSPGRDTFAISLRRNTAGNARDYKIRNFSVHPKKDVVCDRGAQDASPSDMYVPITLPRDRKRSSCDAVQRSFVQHAAWWRAPRVGRTAPTRIATG